MHYFEMLLYFSLYVVLNLFELGFTMEKQHTNKLRLMMMKFPTLKCGKKTL